MKLLKFGAPWCSACKAQSSLFEATPLEGAELVEIDVDEEENQELVNRYSIMSLPTMVLVEDNGNWHKYVGTQPVKYLNEQIQLTLKKEA